MLTTTALVFLLILSVLVLVHELGHFLVAKKLGILVEEFGFGLPPRIFGKRIGETLYSFNWLPIGGFVRLYGEEGNENFKGKKLKKRAFFARPVLQRVLVLVAGVAMNFLLGIFLFSFLFTQGVMVPVERVHLEKILPGSPAEKVGLKEGDIIKKLKFQNAPEKEIKKGEELISATKKHLGEEIVLVVERKKEVKEIKIIPRKEYPSTEGPMGVVISHFEEKKYPFWQAPFYGTKEALILSFELIKGISRTIWKLISFQPVGKEVAGPIGIAQLTGEAVKFGKLAVFELLGILSLNLAIVNLLPFPALDGGRLLFVLWEGVTGKKIKAHWERYVHQVGMVLLLSLMILVTVNDFLRLFGK